MKDFSVTYCTRVTLLAISLVVMTALSCAPTNDEARFARRMLVQARPGISDEALDRILSAYGAERVGVIPQLRVHIYQLPKDAGAPAIVSRLRQHEQIESVEMDERLPPGLRFSKPQPR